MTYRENFKLIKWNPLPETPRKAEIPPARSDLPCPRIMSDQLDKPIQSMVDGSWHTSRSGLRATYKPSGNKDGVRYIEIGDDPSRLKTRDRTVKKTNRREVKEIVEKSVARFERGERVNRNKIAQA